MSKFTFKSHSVSLLVSINLHQHFVLSVLLCFASEVKTKCYLCLVFHFIDYYDIEQLFLCVLLRWVFYSMNYLFIWLPPFFFHYWFQFIQQLSKHPLILGTLLGVRETSMNKTKWLPLWSCHFWRGKNKECEKLVKHIVDCKVIAKMKIKTVHSERNYASCSVKYCGQFNPEGKFDQTWNCQGS